MILVYNWSSGDKKDCQARVSAGARPLLLLFFIAVP